MLGGGGGGGETVQFGTYPHPSPEAPFMKTPMQSELTLISNYNSLGLPEYSTNTEYEGNKDDHSSHTSSYYNSNQDGTDGARYNVCDKKNLHPDLKPPVHLSTYA